MRSLQLETGSRTPAEKDVCRRISDVLNRLVNPVDLFSGAKLEDALLAQNIVVFKRTSSTMLRPRGVTHNYHHRFELVIPLRQSGRIHVDGIGYTLRPGQAFLVFPHQFHHYLDIVGGDLNWLFVTFEFGKPDVLEPLRNSPRVLESRELEVIESMMKEFLSRAPGADRSFGLIIKTSELVRRLLVAREADCAVARDQNAEDPRGAILESINRYVRANLNRRLTIGDLAKHTGYSVSYLRAVFRKEFGVSLGAYLRDSRLSIAASLLSRRERESIESIARACGFVSIFAFSRAFKKAMGVSPTVYSKFVKGSLGAAA